MGLPTEIRLVSAATDAAIEEIRMMMEPDEIWRDLAFESWPTSEEWKAGFDCRNKAAFFIEHESHEIIGFLINGLARFRDWGCVEFALAITSDAYRRRGYGWQTLGLGMEYWFNRGATICWCYYSLTNPGSTGMARQIQSPNLPNGPKRVRYGANSLPAAAGAFTRAQWEDVKRRIGWS